MSGRSPTMRRRSTRARKQTVRYGLDTPEAVSPSPENFPIDPTPISKIVPEHLASKECNWRTNWLGLPILQTYDEIPIYLRDNPYIYTGYRSGYSMVQCVLSLFTAHNESGNVWTHLLGFIFFLLYALLLCSFLLYNEAKLSFHSELFKLPSLFCQTSSSCNLTPTGTDDLVFLVYMIAAMFCMLSSASYHLFCSRSEDTMLFFIRCDLSGIAGLVAGSMIPPFYYLFYCNEYLFITYVSILACFMVGGVVGPQFPFFHSTAFRKGRAFVYGGMALYGCIPVLHSYFLVPLHYFLGLVTWVLILYVIYGCGVFFYVTRFPESSFPGKFDIILNSHTLWHIFVFLGAFAHIFGCLFLFEGRLTLGCPA